MQEEQNDLLFLGPVEELPWWQFADVTAPKGCSVHRGTGEYLGVCEADPSPLEPGVWVFPACGYQLEPPAVEPGFAAIINRDESGWELLVDHRGAVVYGTDDGAPRVWQALGELPEGFTLQAPETVFDTWQGDEWVVDEAAQAEALRVAAYHKQSIAAQYATSRINTLQDAVDLGMASDDEAAALTGWKVYRVELSRLDITASAPADDAWPASPNDAALAAWLAAQNA